MLLLSRYHKLLVERPLLTKSVTTGTLFVVGDCLSQYIEGRSKPKPYSLKRSVVMGSYGLLIGGPSLHFWYAKILANAFPKPGLQFTAVKIALDQTVFTGAFLAIFFYYHSRMHGRTHEQGVAKIRRDIWPTIQANWLVWIPVQIANFTFVPVLYQVLVVNFVGLLWNTFLSYRSNLA
mmetsp:Transcript_19686/g.36222  ORF Transcript_19686/g.36222 Transcript_19686/m.36222 type:complete len:178 (-) Transcript_19686:500-1033(-)